MNGTLPHGPAMKPPSYAKVNAAGLAEHELAAAIAEWYQLTREEWGSLLGKSLKYISPHFKWSSAVGERSKSKASSAAERLWHNAAVDLRPAADAATAGHSRVLQEVHDKMLSKYAEPSDQEGFDKLGPDCKNAM